MKTIKTKTVAFTETQTAHIAWAQGFGVSAFQNGVKSSPCLDKNLMQLVAEYSTADFSLSHVTNALMLAWSNGWHTANAANARLILD
jgi:hypothetical protein